MSFCGSEPWWSIANYACRHGRAVPHSDQINIVNPTLDRLMKEESQYSGISENDHTVYVWGSLTIFMWLPQVFKGSRPERFQPYKAEGRKCEALQMLVIDDVSLACPSAICSYL